MALPTLPNPSTKTRKYIYRVANAAVALAAVKGLIGGEDSAALLFLVNAVLGLADVNATE